MRENEWTNSIKELLQQANLGDDIYFDTLNKVPYAQEIRSYGINFEAEQLNMIVFETDLLVYEKNNVIKPRIIIESKINSVTTHDSITYSYKAQTHKNVTPYLRYGIMLGNRNHYPLPGRLYRHGTNFDFMISFKEFILSDDEKDTFIDLIRKEISYAKKIEEMIYSSRSRDRKHYYLLQKDL
mgnify:CR=1 FL=1